jgi:hypothetical protein
MPSGSIAPATNGDEGVLNQLGAKDVGLGNLKVYYLED